jgi:hydrogenase maturation protease
MAANGAGKAAELLVLGIGNIMCGDDGVGSVVAEQLAKTFRRPGVDILDGGSVGLGLLYLMEEYPALLVIDAVDAGAEPGELFSFRPEDLAQGNKQEISFHQSGLSVLLSRARLLEILPPQVKIIGIQVSRIVPEAGLSAELEAKLDTILEKIRREIEHYHRQCMSCQ